MLHYKYPLKFFCGRGIQLFPPEIFERKVKFFDGLTNVTTPITGETGLDGVLIDFNYGLRLQIPRGAWHVRIADRESEYVFIDDDLSSVTLMSIEKFWIDWEIILWRDGEPVFYHQFDPTDQKVHFAFTNKTLGDNISLLPYVEAFRRKYNCEVTCSIAEYMHGLVEKYFPSIRLSKTLPEDSYACFYMQMAYNLPQAAIEDAKGIPMLRTGQTILRRIESPPKIIYKPTKPRTIAEPYVCIGVQASVAGKGWLNPDGWSTVVEYLHSIGYRVLCIDRDRKCSDGINTIEQPRGVEDMSGDYSLLDRVNQLAYADFFIGLGSGLSWLAWAVDVPVVLISGISEPWCEFDTPYRIINPLVCRGCFNKTNNPKLVNTCPAFGGTERAFECSKNISARQVIDAIERLIADHNLARSPS